MYSPLELSIAILINKKHFLLSKWDTMIIFELIRIKCTVCELLVSMETNKGHMVGKITSFE